MQYNKSEIKYHIIALRAYRGFEAWPGSPLEQTLTCAIKCMDRCMEEIKDDKEPEN